MHHIGFIGYGEAAKNIIEGLQKISDYTMTIYDKNLSFADDAIPERIAVANSISEVVQLSDIVVVAVPGAVDRDVFVQIIESNISGKLFIDICTASAEVKSFNDSVVTNNNGLYVDVAVLGSLPKYKNKVPIVISGSGATEFQEKYSEFCGSIQNAGSEAGDAIRIKLCRSVYMKGLAALLIETKEISKEYGIEKEVFSSLAESMNSDSFEVYSERIINGTYMHCQRRKKELEECLNIFEMTDVNSEMTSAAIKKYENICNNEIKQKI